MKSKLTATVFALTAVMFAFVLCGCKNSKKTEVKKKASSGAIIDNVTEEYLQSFGSPDDLPKDFKGNSRAIDFSPVEGMRVTAEKNAFAHDTEIKVTGVSDAEYNALDKKFAESGVDMLLAYHLDAGLQGDEIMPGEYRVSMDLKKLDIPEALWDRLRFYRVNDKGQITEYLTKIKDGKIIFDSSQNSMVILGWFKTLGQWVVKKLAPQLGQGLLIAPILYIEGSWILRNYVTAAPIFNQYKKESSSMITVTDEWGNFNIIYDQQMSENGSKTDPIDKATGKSKQALLKERMWELHQSAYYKSEAARRGIPTTLDTLPQYRLLTPEQRKSIIAKLSKADIFNQLCQSDKQLNDLLDDDFFKVPESVNKVIKMQRLSNRYLVKVQKLKKTWYTYDIYLSNDEAMCPPGDTNPAYGVALPCDGWFSILALKYSTIVDINSKTGKGTALNQSGMNTMLLTSAHETFHIKQYHYMFSTVLTKDNRFCEATAVILERQFVKWLTAEKLYDNTGGNMDITPTTGREWLSWTITKDVPSDTQGGDAWYEKSFQYAKSFFETADPVNVDVGYMLGEFIQFLLDTKKDVSLKYMFENYSGSKGFKGMVYDDFGFGSEQEFAVSFEKFCIKYMDQIVKEQQKDGENEPRVRGLLDAPVAIDPQNCVRRIKNLSMKMKTAAFSSDKAWPYGIKTFRFEPDKSKAKLQYNLFIVPSEAISQTQMKTVVLNSEYKYDQKNPFFAKVKTDRNRRVEPGHVVVFYRPDIDGKTISSDSWIDVVALFEPEEKPVVKRADDNEKAFIIDPRVKPSTELVSKGYVTGLEIAAKNNRNGTKYVKRVELDDLGKDVEMLYYDLGIKTYDVDRNISVATRWYYHKTDDDGTNLYYYGPASEVVKFKTEAEPVEVEPTPPKEEEPTEVKQKRNNAHEYDFEVSYYYPSEYNNDYNVGVQNAYHDVKVRGHISLTRNRFSLTIPEHKLKVGNTTYTQPALKLSGPTTVFEYEGTDYESYSADLNNISVSPGNVVFKYDYSRYDSDMGLTIYEHHKVECIYQSIPGKMHSTGDGIQKDSFRIFVPIKTTITNCESNNKMAVVKNRRRDQSEPGGSGTWSKSLYISGKRIQ